jgi:hypothetical protein
MAGSRRDLIADFGLPFNTSFGIGACERQNFG